MVLRPHGALFATHFDGKQEERDLLTCAHCDLTWAVIPGSGRRRGYCLRCAQVLCGKAECMAGCTPNEVRIEAMEQRPA
jgi:uncharacterized paraquat-inducible protein A